MLFPEDHGHAQGSGDDGSYRLLRLQEMLRVEAEMGVFPLPHRFATGPNKGKRKVVGITADGSKAKKGVIAADTRKYPFGTIMRVPGYGWGEVHDRGRAIKGNRLDLFFKSHKEALQWGRRRVKVKIFRR